MRPSLDPESIPFSLAGQNQSANGDASHLSAYDLNYAQAEITNNSGTFEFKHQIAWLKIQIKSAAAAETFKEVVVSADEGIANALVLNAVSGTVDATPTSAAHTARLSRERSSARAVAFIPSTWLPSFPSRHLPCLATTSGAQSLNCLPLKAPISIIPSTAAILPAPPLSTSLRKSLSCPLARWPAYVQS